MTIFQPPELDDEAFDRELAAIATEFTTLKRCSKAPEPRGDAHHDTPTTGRYVVDPV